MPAILSPTRMRHFGKTTPATSIRPFPRIPSRSCLAGSCSMAIRAMYPHPGVLRTPRMQLRSAMQSLRSCWSGRRLSASVTQASTRWIPPAMGRARFGVISGTSIRFAARSAPIIIPWPPACRVTQRSPASAHEALAAHATMNSNTTARDIP